MTDETKDKSKKLSNVKPLRKDIKIEGEEKKPEINKYLVEDIERLLEDIKRGFVQGVAYVSSNEDFTSDYNIAGYLAIPDRIYNILEVMKEELWVEAVRPQITGEYYDDE